MCYRYFIENNPQLEPIIEKAKASRLAVRMINKLGKPLKTNGEIQPSDMVPVIAPDNNGKRAAFPMIWGYNIPGAEHPVSNTRIEIASKKDVWKEGWIRHRCIIPACYYFEWEHFTSPDGSSKLGDKYMIQPKGAESTWIAGLYRIEEFRDLKYPVFTMLTKKTTEELQQLNGNMPLILPPSLIDDWINPESKPDDTIRFAVTDLYFEKER